MILPMELTKLKNLRFIPRLLEVNYFISGTIDGHRKRRWSLEYVIVKKRVS